MVAVEAVEWWERRELTAPMPRTSLAFASFHADALIYAASKLSVADRLVVWSVGRRIIRTPSF